MRIIKQSVAFESEVDGNKMLKEIDMLKQEVREKEAESVISY